MDTQLNFINNSNDNNNSEVVIFQKNVATDFSELAVAWRVIKNCGQGDNHPFVFPEQLAVSATDADGNLTPKLNASKGQLLSVEPFQGGSILKGPAQGTSPYEIHVLNALTSGSINANIYRNDKLLATKTNIVPQQKAVFEFKPTIWIGVVSQVTEGEVMNSAIISSINTELSLLGIAQADIVMTGGGPGRNATPFSFSLQNIVMA